MASYTYGQLTVPVTADTRGMEKDISGAATSAGQQAAGHINTSMSGGLRAAGGLAASVGKSVATGLGTATIAATGFGIEAFKSAARVGEMDASLRALAKANGLSYTEMQANVTAIRKQGIEANVAQSLVAQFARSNLDLSKSTDLARVAQDAAVISGRNSTEVLDDLVHGITTQNTMVLRNAGIQVNATKAQDDYAKSIGKSRAQLTEAEKAQAVLNAVLDQGKTVAGAYAEAMNEPGKVLRSFPRIIDDIKVSVGQGLVKALGPAIIQLYDLAKALSAAVAPGGALEPIFAAIGVAVGKLVAPVTAMISTWAKWIENLRPEQIQRVTDVIKQFGPAILGGAAALGVLTGGSILTKIPILGGVLQNLLGPIKLVTGGLAKLAGGAVAAIPGISGMGSAAGLLPAAMNPVGAVVVGIAAAIGVLLVASKDFREGVIALGKALLTGLQPALSAVWGALKSFGAGLWEIIKAIGDALGPALKNLAPLLEQIGKLFGANLAGGAEGAGGAMDSIVPVIVGLIKVIGFLLDITTKVLVPIIEVPLKLMVWASAILQVLNPLKLIAAAISWLTETAIKLWHWITGNSPGLIPAFGLLGSAASALANLLGGPISGAFRGLVSVVSSATSAISGAVTGAFRAMPGIVSGAMGQISSVVSSGFSSMVGQARSAGASMIDGLKNGLSAAKSMGGWIGSNVTGPVVGFIKSGFGTNSPSTITLTVGTDVIAGLKKGLDAARQLGGWVNANVADPILGALKSGLDAAAMTPVGQQMIAGLQQGLSAASSMGGWIQQNVAGPILGSIKGAFGIGSPSRYTMPMGEDLMAGVEVGMARAADHLAVPDVPVFASPLAGNAPGMAGFGAAGSGATINVYPQAGQDEREIAALVSRELAWASAGGVR